MTESGRAFPDVNHADLNLSPRNCHLIGMNRVQVPALNYPEISRTLVAMLRHLETLFLHPR